MLKNYKKRGLVALLAIATGALSMFSPIARAETIAGYGLTMSPMDEKILLNPGDSYTSPFSLSAPTTYDTPAKYTLEATGYFINEEGGNVFEECGGYCEMKDWITIDSPATGKLEPGEQTEIFFTINVPENAGGGGQYASIMATIEKGTDDSEQVDDKDAGSGEIKSTINEEMRMSHIIYAEVTGDVVRQGDITSASVPGFLLSGNISGSSTIKNNGNVHSSATYKLQVFPLFSDEEVYTNEENPETGLILPERSRYNVIEWKDTPSLGIFNVVYTVDFEGKTTEIKKMVIICPLWLLIIIIIAIIALVVWLYTRSKSRKK